MYIFRSEERYNAIMYNSYTTSTVDITTLSSSIVVLSVGLWNSTIRSVVSATGEKWMPKTVLCFLCCC